MGNFVARFRQNQNGTMAVMGGALLSVMVVGAGAAIDLSRLSSAKTELTQIARFSCESAAVAMAAKQTADDAKRDARTLARNSIDESSLLGDDTAVQVSFPDGSNQVRVVGSGDVKLMFGGLFGKDIVSVAASTNCPVTSAPIDLNDPVQGCVGDAIIITNATRFEADAATAERLTTSRTISVAFVDQGDALQDRVIVGDGGQPSYQRTGMSLSDKVIIQPVIAGTVVPVVCIPRQPPPPTSSGGGTGGGGGACMTGNMSGAAVGRELSFDTDGNYKAFITDASAGLTSVAVDNGIGATADSSASLDGPGIGSGSASVGDGSSASCSAIVAANANILATATASGEITDTSTNTTLTHNGDGTVTSTSATASSSETDGASTSGTFSGTVSGTSVTSTINSSSCTGNC